MLKNVLIISPYFPPTNAADMQRVRMSLPYFRDLGWNAEIVTVHEHYSDLIKDELLLESVPRFIKVHKVKALSKQLTSKIGLGSISLRSLIFFRNKVNELLRLGNYDLIYFSTTQFAVCVLGPYWKNKFGVPYVIDMQDPWHSEYYKNKIKSEQPPKYWFSYRMNKYLERIALKKVNGLISVSAGYIEDLISRYPRLANIPSAVITFGSFDIDLQIAEKHRSEFHALLNLDHKNIVYIGRGGSDLRPSINYIFNALREGLETDPDFSKIKFYFIGTSYASNGLGEESIMPIARKFGVQDQVIEMTDRISFYHALITLKTANALFIPGSEDVNYTASKIYPYISTQKPILAILNKASSATNILKEHGAKYVFDFETTDQSSVIGFFKSLLANQIPKTSYDEQIINKYSAMEMARRQCEFFNEILNEKI